MEKKKSYCDLASFMFFSFLFFFIFLVGGKFNGKA